MIENRLIGFRQLFKESAYDFISRFGIIVAFSAITFALNVAFLLVIGAGIIFAGINNFVLGATISIIASLVFLLLGWFVFGAFTYSMKEGADFKESFTFIWKNFKSYIWIAILTFFAILPGVIMFIIPGLIIMMFLMFSTYVFIDDRTKGIAALKKSMEYISGRFWTITKMSVLLIVALAGVGIAFGGSSNLISQMLFSSFIATPVILCFCWRLFKDIKAKKPELSPGEESNFIKTLAIIGGVIFLGFIILGFILISTNLPAAQQAIQEFVTKIITSVETSLIQSLENQYQQ